MHEMLSSERSSSQHRQRGIVQMKSAAQITNDFDTARQRSRIDKCPHPHADFDAMARCVGRDFHRVPELQLQQDLQIAQEAVSLIDLGEDSLEMAELITRHRLLLRTGAVDDAARLDPQSHTRRRDDGG